MKRITGKKAIKKKNPKNKKIIIMGIIMVIIVIFLAIRILPTIKNVEVIIDFSTSKETKITEEQILTLANLKKGDRLYKELRSEIEKRVETNPYVKTAKVKRSLNGKVTIEVSQREPIYMVNYAGEYIYIDQEGYVLEVSNINNEATILIGLTTNFSELEIGKNRIRLNQEDLEKIDMINTILLSLKSNEIENAITSIDITDKKNIILHLANDEKDVYIGDESDINTKILYMKKILESESGRAGTIYINGKLDDGYVYFREQ